MLNFTKTLAFALTSYLASAQTDAEREAYPLLAESMDKLGYSWEAYEVQTQDGWNLSLFRVTGNLNDGNPSEEDKAGKLPVLAIHGACSSGNDWLGFGSARNPNVLVELFDLGYDVWAGNARGTPYSNTNVNDDTWTLEEKWNFTWADMGKYDIPTNIEKVLEVTGQDQLTYLGWSQGTSQMLYALAKDQDYYADKVNRFVALAACVQRSYYGSYEEEVSDFQTLKQLGIYNWSGGDASTATKDVCDDVKGMYCNYVKYCLNGQSVASEMYAAQTTISDRFQEPISLEDWAAGVTESDLVDVSLIDRVPVTILMPKRDGVCPPEKAEEIFAQIQSEKYWYDERGGHGIALKRSQGFIDRLSSVIATGQEPQDLPDAATVFGSLSSVAIAMLVLFQLA